MAFVIKQVAEHGVSNPIVARLGLQTLEIMKKTTLDDAKSQVVGDLYLETLQPKLLRCWEIKERFRSEFNSKAEDYEAPKQGARAVEVPQIMRLREECHNFLYEAKNYLRGVLKVMNALYGTQFDEASEFVRARKGKHKHPSVIEYAESTFGSDDPKTRFLREAARGVEELIWSRNAVEHEGGHSGTLEISNFELLPDGRLAEPEWQRLKDGTIVFGPSSLRSDFVVAIGNLLTLGEDVFVSWAADNLSDPEVFTIASIPLEQRDPEMPVRWKVGVSQAFWERIGRPGE